MNEANVTLVRVGLSPGPLEDEVESPSAADVAEMVRKIDGDTYDQLYLEATRDGMDVQIAIVGGHRGVAMHIALVEAEETYYLREVDGHFSPEYVLVSSGGSEIDVLARWLVPIDRAARGLWYFLLTGDLDPGLAWDRLSEVDFNPPP